MIGRPPTPEPIRFFRNRTGLCKRGHELAGANLIVNKKGWKSCKTCQRMKADEWRQRRAAA